MMRAVCGAFLIAVALAAPAWAQSGTGVSVSLVGDVARFNGSEIDSGFIGGNLRDGEALGFSLRVDRALGSRWGLELEYMRGGEMDFESRPISRPVEDLSSRLFGALVGSSPILVPPNIFIAPQVRVTSRLSTVSTLAWFRQRVGDRTSLVYSGGIAFGIGQTEQTYSYAGLPNQNTIPPVTTELTSYTVNPIVGLDARIAMTDHASVVPGIRVLGADGGIRIRPSVGLRWEF